MSVHFKCLCTLTLFTPNCTCSLCYLFAHVDACRLLVPCSSGSMLLQYLHTLTSVLCVTYLNGLCVQLLTQFFRAHALQRWTFCDITQVAEGPGRWRRYFYARARIDANIDQGRPGFDYRVCTKEGSLFLSATHSETVQLLKSNSDCKMFRP